MNIESRIFRLGLQALYSTLCDAMEDSQQWSSTNNCMNDLKYDFFICDKLIVTNKVQHSH